MTEVLVSGASVAGTTLAYWLAQHGFSVTVVERHPGPAAGRAGHRRAGSRAGKCWTAWGCWPPPQDRKTNIRGSSMVDGDGNELSRDTESTPTGGPIDNPDIELLRDDLVELLYEATQNSTEYLFDDSIVALDNRGPCVDVTFERAPARSFDLVIGADGLHSNVRGLIFGPEERFIKRLGTFAAIFTVPNFLDLDHWQMWHYGETSMAGVYSARNNTEARAMLGFMDPELQLDYRDTEAQFAEAGTADGRRRLGAPATAEVHAQRTGLLLRRNVADRHGSLVDRQGGAGGRRRVLLLAVVGPGHQRRPAGRLHPGRRAQIRQPRQAGSTTVSPSPTTSGRFAATPCAPNSWPPTTFRAVRPSRRSSSRPSSTRSRCASTNAEQTQNPPRARRVGGFCDCSP